MPTETITYKLSGDGTYLYDGPSAGALVSGSVSLYRVRAKKSASGGHFAFNIDAASSKANKYPPWQDALLDINPESLEPVLSDGDDLSDIPDDVSSKEATSPSGDEPEFATSGANITTKPAMEMSSSSKLAVGTGHPSFASGEPFTVAIVLDAGSNAHRSAIGSDVGSSSYCTWYGNNGSRRTFVQDESGNSITSASQDYFQDSDIRVLTRDSSNTVTEYRRGSQTVTGTLSGTMSFNTLGWVAQSSSYEHWDSLGISRVLVLDRYSNSTEREEIEAWLAWYYGLQTSTNSYLPSSHVGYRVDAITDPVKAFTSDIDISSLGADTWSSYSGPNTSTVSGSIDIIPTKAYKAGDVTIEVLVSWS